MACVVDKLLALSAHCTSANMVSAHIFFNADMDIDCDGRPTGDKCPGPDPSYQADTAFHNLQDQPLEAAVTPYVVIPADFASYACASTLGIDPNPPPAASPTSSSWAPTRRRTTSRTSPSPGSSVTSS